MKIKQYKNFKLVFALDSSLIPKIREIEILQSREFYLDWKMIQTLIGLQVLPLIGHTFTTGEVFLNFFSSTDIPL